MIGLKELCINRQKQTLEIPKWDKMWEPIHTTALLEICHRYNIEQLIFVDGHFDATWMKMFVSYGDNKRYHFLPHLRSIIFKLVDIHPALKHIINCTRVWEIKWEFPETLDGLNQEDVGKVLEKLNEDGMPFHTNYSLKFLYFTAGKYSLPHIVPDFVDINSWLTCCTIDPWLERNRYAFEKCRKAVFLLLGSRKRKTGGLISLLVKDVANIIAQIVWETRGTKVWTN
jgi:hypothetical protein